MSIKELHDNIREHIPEGDGRYYPPEAIDNFVHMAVMDLCNQNLKAYEESQRISDSLAHLLASAELDVSAGITGVPTNLSYITSLRCIKIGTQAVNVRARLVNEQFFDHIATSEAFGPNEENVVVRRIAGNFEVLPTTVTQIRVSYLRHPAKAKYGYTLSGNFFVYDEISSVPIDWPEKDHTQIIVKALRYMGIATREPALIQSEAVSKAGNQPEAR